MVYASVSLALFNSMVLAYVIIYLYYSMWNPTMLPWTQCDPSWADEQCYVKKEGIFPCKEVEQMALNKYKPEWLPKISQLQSFVLQADANSTSNGTVFEGRPHASNCINATQISSYHFYYKRVLGFSPQSRDPNSYQAHLVLAVALGWCCVFVCVHDGIRSLGKLWGRAAEQVILSLGLGYGTVICYAGYGRIRNKLINDLEIIIVTQFFANVGFGLVIFSVLGFLASDLQIYVEDIITSGFDLAFVAYPEAVSHFRNASLWVVCFYASLFCMALNAQCATVQAVLSPVRDEFSPAVRPRRWVLAATGCLVLMLFGLPMTRQDGIFTLKMFNAYFGDLLLPMLALFETCFVVHGYGENKKDYDEALAVNEDWGPRDPDERLRYHAFLKSQDAEAAVDAPSEDTTTDARSQGRSSGEEGESDIDDMVAVAVEEIPPEATAVMSDSIGAQSEDVAQCSDSDHNAGLARTLVISESGVSVVTTPLSDGKKGPHKAASVS
nr:sodium- and chloride-dependent glycine transporter 2-like [Rhipicephalus microplus]